MEKVAFIINPFSAKKNYQPFLKALEQCVPNALYYISESVQGTEDFIAKHFDTTDIFVAMGGDGTISSVAKSIINTDKILAIYPGGSGNGFSNETGFSKDIDKLMEKISKKNIKTIDTFMVNEHFSINVSGTGFDGEVVKAFEKTSRGFKNYIKVCIRTFFRYHPIRIEFSKSEYQKYNGQYLMVNVANTRQFGNNAYIAPKADMNDGLLEVVLVKKFPFWYAALFAYRMFSKKLKDDKYVSFLSVPEIEFLANTDSWHIDGDYHSISSPVKVKILPKSLRILAP